MPPLNQPMYYVQDVPVQYLHLSKALRVLGLCPAVWGVYAHLVQAHRVGSRNARALDSMTSSALDYYVGVLWCLLGGLWSFWLTNSLIRRWFVHYDPRPAIIRLFTLGTIYWFSVMFFVSYFGDDEPIWPWMVICAILAVVQTVQILHFRVKRHYKLEANEKPRRDSRSLIYRTVLIPGGVVSFLTMVILLHQNNMRPSTAEALATGGASSISTTSDTKLVIGAAQIQVLIIILSSWTPKAFQRRQEIRNTSLKLAPPASSKFAYTYKFILGEAPSSHARNTMGAKISDEIQRHDDVLLLSVSDAQQDRSHKVFKALEWSNKFKFDFLCKTDDDVFVRDIVTLLAYPGPRIFAEHEDVSIGVWLHPFNIKPKHDRRIQQWDVCEDDMIAKHFGDTFKPIESMQDIHWKDRGIECDSVQGIMRTKAADDLEGGLTVDIKDAMPPLANNPQWIIPGILSDTSSIFSDTEDWARLHWAIWTTDAATTWQPRHYLAIESTFVHNPNAVLIILSNTLPSTFFADYTRQGYQIHIMPFSKDMLLRREWFFGSETQAWLQNWDEWNRKGSFFPVHLADYLRLVALYKYGGLYMDLDAIWVRAPGDAITEFIGSDVSDTDSDLAWTLDDKNTYLANGVMRFKRGRSMFRQIASSVFTVATYDPECFNCGGPKAFTTYVKTHRVSLEKNGLRILPRTALYPYNWKEITAALEKTDMAEDKVLQLEEHGIGLHLYGKVTSRKEIEDGSVVAAVLKIWALDLSPAVSSNDQSSDSRLQGPKVLYYYMPPTPAATAPTDSLLAKVPGTFKGIDAVFIRGTEPSTGPVSLRKASILITVKEGSIATRRIEMDLGDAVSMGQLNLALSHLRYFSPATRAWSGTDQIVIQVEFGTMREQLDIPVVRRTNTRLA
ncbi:hypothetical protein BGZ98_005712 [Dissophora globulifera]|nr:hypothetical protein BGZ98_005712 [Dissophora globulifera]